MLSQETHESSVNRGEGTQAIDRAAEILVRVLEGSGTATVGELALETGLPKSTASRLVGALERHGLVQRESVRGPLRPGPTILRFARTRDAMQDVIDIASPALQRLAEASAETVNLAVPSSFGVEHIAQVETRHILGAGTWVGRRVPLHCSGNGKVFLSSGAAKLPDGPLERLTPRTVTDRELLASVLQDVRVRGFATTIDEIELGLTAVAAGIYGPEGSVIAALSVSGPTARLGQHRLDDLGAQLVREAAEISHRLGYRKGVSQ